MSQPRISFHLRILREANILKARKEGKWVYYHLSNENQVLKRVLDIIDKELKLDFNKMVCEVKNE
jgi:ArsR family transcriptional regulator